MHSQLSTVWPEPPPAVVASTLLPEQFRQTAGLIRQLLNNWQRYGLGLQDIERDLLLLGVVPEHLGILAFLTRLSPIKERVWLDGVEGNQSWPGIPTIDDVNILWDARPLFGGSSYYYFKADCDAPCTRFGPHLYCHRGDHQSDSYGREERTAISSTRTASSACRGV